ncbi:hypothetical protein GUJ93_ZPchr0004g38397 [Zizania palustris]|uniref:Uncharacterized protein n=1 Tax=Zizania palustris TaxID=103762 RepID=A0A8J5SQD6_ZIZPA|nr:hypothetical protein GUJ93_ZPchr0004g38397 [Zizania palustris]
MRGVVHGPGRRMNRPPYVGRSDRKEIGDFLGSSVDVLMVSKREVCCNSLRSEKKTKEFNLYKTGNTQSKSKLDNRRTTATSQPSGRKACGRLTTRNHNKATEDR